MISSRGYVVSVGFNAVHSFIKPPQMSIRLLAGLGVEGDAHLGATTQHRWLVKKDPTRRNLTQVHLLHAELFDELKEAGFALGVGDLGENVTTQGIELLGLPTGTKLHLGSAIVEVTGLREPCVQLNKLQPGLMKALIERKSDVIIRRAGIMGVVLNGGEVCAGDEVQVEHPPQPWVAMGPV